MDNKTRIAINGFGRIGRSAAKIILAREDMEIVAVNDLADTETLAHLLKYDTAYGPYEQEISHGDNQLIIDGTKIPVLTEKDPVKLPWKEMDVDVVLEATGVFTKDGAAKKHIEAGARRVIVSAPTKGSGGIKTYLMGVNTEQYQSDEVISNASCTTNCVGPVISILQEHFGIKKAAMTTIHGYTSSQNLQDGPRERARKI
jgi:glyceraldehyde 3-phosphate dehydrogenase